MEPDFLIGFLDSCIESLKLSKEDDVNGIMTRNELIEKLVERKRNVELTLKKKIQSNAKKSRAPDVPGVSDSSLERKPEKITKKSLSSSAVGQVHPPQSQPIQESSSMQVLTAKLDDISMSSEISGSDPHTTTSGDTSSEITTISRHEILSQANNVPQHNHRHQQANHNSDSAAPSSSSRKSSHSSNHVNTADKSPDFEIASETVYQMVDAVRQNTNLSHELSCVALRTILSEMEMVLPRKASPYLEAIAVHLGSSLLAPDNLLGETHDARRLRAIFADLADCKNDSEQRTWMLYEDEDDIVQYIQELTGILVSYFGENELGILLIISFLLYRKTPIRGSAATR